jgi:hypothetical protein
MIVVLIACFLLGRLVLHATGFGHVDQFRISFDFFLVVGSWLYLGVFAFPIMAVFGTSAWTTEKQHHMADDLYLADIRARQLADAKAARLWRWSLLLAFPVLLTSLIPGFAGGTWQPFVTFVAFCHMTISIFGFGVLGLWLGQQFRGTLTPLLCALGLTLGFGLGTSMLILSMSVPSNGATWFSRLIWTPSIAPIVALVRAPSEEMGGTEVAIAIIHGCVVGLFTVLSLRPRHLPGRSES